MPDEYISREAARRMVNQLPRYTWSSPVSTDYCVAVSKDAVLFGLGRIPAADVAPVVHGQWDGEGDGYADGEIVIDVWYCSKCAYCIDDGTDDPDRLPNFCPDCGARMDGGDNDAAD